MKVAVYDYPGARPRVEELHDALTPAQPFADGAVERAEEKATQALQLALKLLVAFVERDLITINDAADIAGINGEIKAVNLVK